MKIVIKQVFNNNTILVTVGSDKEAILQGKGIGFGKRRGDTVDPKAAQRTLYLTDDQMKDRFSELLKNVPIDIVVTSFRIIDNAQEKYQYHVLNYIYVTLTDHIFQMYKRLLKGQYHPTPVPDMQSEYPLAYEIAADGLRLINQNLSVHFPNVEIKSLALHFINAKGEDSEPSPDLDLNGQIDRIVMNVFKKNNIVRNTMNANYFDRMMIHLQYLVDRIQTTDDRADLSTQISQDFVTVYPQSTSIADQIVSDIEHELNLTLDDNERIYFIIHIQRIIQEN